MSLICVVDDDDMVRQTIVMLLEMHGFELQEATNGEEALDLLKKSPCPPCVILLDLMMPVMDGLEFRKHQLRDPALATVPVILITGKLDLGNHEEFRPLSVIGKPFELSTLLTMVNQYCPVG